MLRLEERSSVSMDTENVMNHIRKELREQPGSRYSEVYLRTVEHGAGGAKRARGSYRNAETGRG
jgi:3-hydroxyacyl-CoA dehydrogenase